MTVEDAMVFSIIGKYALIASAICLALFVGCIIVIVKCAKLYREEHSQGGLIGIILGAIGCFFFGIWLICTLMIGGVFTAAGTQLLEDSTIEEDSTLEEEQDYRYEEDYPTDDKSIEDYNGIKVLQRVSDTDIY